MDNSATTNSLNSPHNTGRYADALGGGEGAEALIMIMHPDARGMAIRDSPEAHMHMVEAAAAAAAAQCQQLQQQAVPLHLHQRAVPPQLLQQQAVPPQLLQQHAVPPQLLHQQAVPPQLQQQAMPPQLLQQQAMPAQMQETTANMQLRLLEQTRQLLQHQLAMLADMHGQQQQADAAAAYANHQHMQLQMAAPVAGPHGFTAAPSATALPHLYAAGQQHAPAAAGMPFGHAAPPAQHMQHAAPYDFTSPRPVNVATVAAASPTTGPEASSLAAAQCQQQACNPFDAALMAMRFPSTPLGSPTSAALGAGGLLEQHLSAARLQAQQPGSATNGSSLGGGDCTQLQSTVPPLAAAAPLPAQAPAQYCTDAGAAGGAAVTAAAVNSLADMLDTSMLDDVEGGGDDYMLADSLADGTTNMSAGIPSASDVTSSRGLNSCQQGPGHAQHTLPPAQHAGGMHSSPFAAAQAGGQFAAPSPSGAAASTASGTVPAAPTTMLDQLADAMRADSQGTSAGLCVCVCVEEGCMFVFKALPSVVQQYLSPSQSNAILLVRCSTASPTAV